MSRCPLSYQNLPQGQNYSTEGLRRIHPRLRSLANLPWTGSTIRREAAQRMGKMSIQGVQPKVSLSLKLSEGRFDMVDRGGTFILKPAIEEWPHVPENEDLTMRMAALCNIETPGHGLVRVADNELAFVIRRFDRTGRNRRLAIEDFAQLSGKSRDTKYASSTEQLIGVINQYATFPAIDVRKLFNRIVFCFLAGNEDAHLKNWSLFTFEDVVGLSPAYDLVNTWLVLPNPTEELALPLKGKKSNLNKEIFLKYLAKERLELPNSVVDADMQAFQDALPRCFDLIEISFLPLELKERYAEILHERALRLGLNA